ncbi:MAG TPA: protein kinase [Gemmatimonadaceae bacterium]|nr:protein kinase [Gemmatimonadaceae bacterium]
MTPGETTVEFGRRCRHCGSELSPTSSFCSKCGATAVVAPDADVQREKLRALFGEDLDIERELGRGGMAAVYAAFDPALQRRVAVKVLLPEIANDRAAADRFLKEARTVASLQHPNVVTVYAVRSRDGVHAIVMQFVEGRGLDSVLNERTMLPVHVAGMLLAHTAAGLQHAHDRGVIHRDVKPSNVLIDREGRAVVSDFGIARREGGPQTTETGMVIGTWAYMSPEQRTATSITPATDQYALGVMAFELLSGRLPFEGTAHEMLRAHLHAPPPSVRDLRPDVPPAVDAIIQRMMAKDPADRLPSLREAERLFGTLVPDEGQTTMQLAAYSHVRAAPGSQVMAAQPRRPAERPAESPTASAASAASAAPNVPVRPPGRRIGPAIAGAVVGVTVLVAAWQFTRSPADSGRPTVQGPAPAATGGSPAPSGATATEPATPPAGGAPPVSRGTTAHVNERSVVKHDAAAGTSRDASVPGGQVTPASIDAAGAVPLAGAAVPSSGAGPLRDNQPRADAGTSPSPGGARGDAPPAPAIPAAPAATRDDARKLGRDFVTMLNQRQFRDVAAIPAMGGDAGARDELIRLVQSAADFAAGFDRLPVAPAPWTKGFETEFDVDLEWRGGKKLLRVRLYAAQVDGAWRIAGLAVDPAG